MAPVVAAHMVPPLSPYGTLTGDLFLYAGGRAAFESGFPPSVVSDQANKGNKKCILLGGLSDGLMPVPYTSLLDECCMRNSFGLIQPILSSSYTGFGHGSLDRDCKELCELIDYLEAHRSPPEEGCQFCLVGHSTGCQDIVHFLKVAPPEYRRKVLGVVLQASVSDREHSQMDTESHARNLALAQEMRRNNQLDECMPRSAFWAPITARRFLDLQERGGADDYFSSDYSDEELKARLGHMSGGGGGGASSHRHILVAFSGADEYVPDHVDSSTLTDRLVKAMSSESLGEEIRVTGLFIPDANHNLSEPASGGSILIEHVENLLRKINTNSHVL